MQRVLWGILLALLLPVSAFASDEISEVRIVGNRRIERDAVISLLASKTGRPMRRETVRGDIKKLYGSGYFSNVEIGFDPEKGLLTVAVTEKTTIREVKFSGNQKEDTEDLQKEVVTKPFGYLDENRIREDVEKLRSFYDSKGFYLAEVTSEIRKTPNNEAILTFKVKEDRKVMVRRITFIGNRVISDDELKNAIRTKEKGFLSFLTGSGSYREEMLAEDRQILRDTYGHRGYIKAKIGSPRVQLSPDKRSLSLTFTIEEGDPYRVGTVGLDGELIRSRSELMKSVKLTEGELADTLQIQGDIAALSNLYADEGYAYVNVIPRDTYDEEKKIVNLTYLFQPGPKVRVERIRISGNGSTRDKVIRREVQLGEGEQFSGTKIRQSRENIERLALFEDVKLTYPRGSADDRVDLVIEVKEKQTGTLSLGAGFNTLESFQILGRVEKRNLFGYGVDLSFDARIGGKTQAFNLQYRDEYFLDTKWGLTLNAFSISRKYSNFDLTSRGGNVGFDYPLYVRSLKRLRAGLTYSITNQDLSNLEPTVENLFKSGVTSSVTASLSWDTRNRVFEPSKGSFLRASEEVAGGPFGGHADYSKSELDGSWYFPAADQSTMPLIGGSVFALHLNLGFVAPIKENERVPLFERYFPGGIFSIRGFQLRSLGPKIRVASTTDAGGFTTTDFVIGGNKQAIFNAEYIYPIVRAANIKGVFFFDMGNAFDNGESMFTITGQRQSAGFGIRWFSPIGPLRFEWGFPLDKKEDESRVVFDFTIGSIF
ncbi:MAG: outer membrane protein assembly factor BamA [Pseudomonadota bacterium]